MSGPPLPSDESGRLAALQSYEILDTAAESQYDDLVDLAAHICEAPVALISLIDEDRQWFKARHGLEAQETERDVAFCAHAILQPESFVVEDALADERFADNPLVTAEPKIRFYAGVPLINPEGHALGTLCVIDTAPRRLLPDHEKALRILSRHVMGQLELRRRTLETERLRRQNAALEASIADRGGANAACPPGPSPEQRQLLDAERARRALLNVLEDQKQVEERLRASEARYRHLFEQNPAPMLIYERGSLQLLAVNEAFSRHYGYSQEQALGLLLTDLYPSGEKQRISELAARLQGYADVGEWHHRRQDGETITIVASSHDTLFEGRQARIAVITDITERKRAERALHDSEERLRLALNAANQGLYDLDLRTGDAVVSPEYAQMLGYDPEDFHETNAAWRARLHPDDVAHVEQTFEEYVAGRIPDYRVEFRQRARDGSWKWILSLGKIQERDSEGRPIRLLGTHTDISAIHTATEALQQSEALLAEAQAMAHLGNWNLDLATGVASWSDEEYRLLGYAPGTVQPSNERFLEAVHHEDRERVIAEMQRVMDPSETEPYHVTHRVTGPDGMRVVEEQGRVVFNADGQPLRMHGTTLDITARHQAQEEARVLTRELEERVGLRTRELEAANKELETFTYSVSHDLKAPLRGIDGYSRLLLEDHLEQLDEEGQLFLQNVRRGVEQMGQLIEDLLAYSRIERRSLAHSDVDLGRLVETIVHERADDIAARQVGLHIELDVQTVKGDSDGLALVLRNLLDNALKFSHGAAAPSVEIAAQETEAVSVITVTDNGIGFDMRFHDRIFEIFQRLQRAEDYPGTGIGLAIVRKAVQRMGGSIRAESSPDKGARFIVELPK
jgi:PAS domain S-box-containing protein